MQDHSNHRDPEELHTQMQPHVKAASDEWSQGQRTIQLLYCLATLVEHSVADRGLVFLKG